MSCPQSAIIPITVLAVDIFVSFHLIGMYGIALSALGMLSNLATTLSIDVYGPICDNAGGIAEMSALPPSVREKTDALDAAGNTTAAIGKGFAIGSLPWCPLRCSAPSSRVCSSTLV